ncbi:MAG: hypothetical protein V3W31_09600 [Thermodesulfobacteriota bacterium]
MGYHRQLLRPKDHLHVFRPVYATMTGPAVGGLLTVLAVAALCVFIAFWVLSMWVATAGPVSASMAFLSVLLFSLLCLLLDALSKELAAIVVEPVKAVVRIGARGLLGRKAKIPFSEIKGISIDRRPLRGYGAFVYAVLLDTDAGDEELFRDRDLAKVRHFARELSELISREVSDRTF